MQITLHYRAFGDHFDVPVPVPGCFDADPHTLLEALFKETNLYEGPFWDRLDLPANRRHTALSVGDEISINDTTYRCQPVGWSVVERGA